MCPRDASVESIRSDSSDNRMQPGGEARMRYRVVQGRLQRIPPVERHVRPTQIPGMRHSTSELQGHDVDEPEAVQEAIRRSMGMTPMDPREHATADASPPIDAYKPTTTEQYGYG